MSERNNVISIVTPSYNQGEFIADTIESVIFQKGYFYIDYIIMDGGSTDNTLDIIRYYENHLKKKCTVKVMGDKSYYISKIDFNQNASQDDIWLKNPLSVSCKGVSFTWESKKDKGQYDAIKQGFEKAAGSIFAYINSDDMYLPDAFSTVVKVFLSHPPVHWIKGTNVFFNEIGDFFSDQTIYSNYILRKGYYDGINNLHFFQQESTFWTRDIYERVGGIPTHFQYAGDYALWKAFSQIEKMYMIPCALGGFRFQRNQKTRNMAAYYKEVDMITKRNNLQRVFCLLLHRVINNRAFSYFIKPYKIKKPVL